MSLIRWIVYGLLFFGLIRSLNSQRRIEIAVATLLVLATFDTLYGIMQTYSGYGHIWWFKSSAYGRDVGGTFLSRNLFAGLLEMTITLALGYAVAISGEGASSHRDSGTSWRRNSLKKRFVKFFSVDTLNQRLILVVFSGGVMALGLFLSASRGGIIATATAILLMGLVFFFRKGERRAGRIILMLFVVALIFALYVGVDYTLGRFQLFDKGVDDRMVMAKKAVELFCDYDTVGVGIGNFRYAFGKYHDTIQKNLYVDFAHNDFIQFLAEAGIVGVIFLVAGLGWFVFHNLSLWKKRSAPLSVYLGIVPLIALFAVAIHAVSEYNLHRPSHTMVLAAIVAIGCASLRLEVGRRNPRVIFTEHFIPLFPGGAVLLAGAVAVIAWSGIWTVRHFVAEAYCSTDFNMTLKLDPNPSAESVREAIAWDFGNAAYHFKLAGALMVERDQRMQGPNPDHEGWKKSHDAIAAELERAIALNPLNAEYHVRLAWEYSYMWDKQDYMAKWLPAADTSIERASYLAGNWPQNPRLHYDMGNYWTMRAKVFGVETPQGKIAMARAMKHYRKGMEVERVRELPKDIQAFIK
jgi:O-antigen ligase